jgi:hypothetical protein
MKRGRYFGEETMGHARKDTLAKSVEWAKHLRPFGKRRQARKERNAVKHLIATEKSGIEVQPVASNGEAG